MSNLTKYISDLEKIEFNSDKDIDKYARCARRVAQELHLKFGMDSELIQATLSQYKGHWYEFGVGNKARAKIVAAHLKVSAEAAKALGVGAQKMNFSFRKHFVKPERDARREHERNKRTRAGKFTIDPEG